MPLAPGREDAEHAEGVDDGHDRDLDEGPDAERAALALTEEGTRIIDGHQGVSDETWARVRKHYDDDQTIALVSLIAMINPTNRLGVILNNQGGDYEPGNLATIAG